MTNYLVMMDQMRRTERSQTLFYILRSIFEGKNEDQIAKRFDGDTVLVKTWVDALKRTRLITKNSFNELVVTTDGKDYLEKFDSL